MRIFRARLARLRRQAEAIEANAYVVYLASRDPRVPWLAKAVAAATAAYALSPIDLIPDVIPVLGYLDDLILVPLGLALALRLVPPDVLAELRGEAARRRGVDAKTIGVVESEPGRERG